MLEFSSEREKLSSFVYEIQKKFLLYVCNRLASFVAYEFFVALCRYPTFLPRSSRVWRNLFGLLSRLLPRENIEINSSFGNNIKKTFARSVRSRNCDVIASLPARTRPTKMTSNEMAKMTRLFSASDMSVATWLFASSTGDITRRIQSVTQRDGGREISSIG